MCKMVSLDTSSTITGFCIFKAAKVIDYGRIDKSREKDSIIRMEDMILSIHALLNKVMPDIVVIELNVVPRNAHTQRILSEILGAVFGWCLCNNAEYVEYRPSEWRRLVKDEGEKVPRDRDELKIWSLDKAISLGYKPDDDNISDAILIGLARIRHLCGEAA